MNPRRAISSVTTKIHVQRVRMRTRTYVDRVPSNVATDSVLAPYGALTVSLAYVIVSSTCTLTLGLFPRFNHDLHLSSRFETARINGFCLGSSSILCLGYMHESEQPSEDLISTPETNVKNHPQCKNNNIADSPDLRSIEL